MGTETKKIVSTHTEANQRGYPFGLSSRQLFVLVGLINSGFLVYALEEANLSAVVDLVWIVGYGTTISVVWFIWIRPLDLVGTSAQDTSLTEESDQPETAIDGHNASLKPRHCRISGTGFDVNERRYVLGIYPRKSRDLGFEIALTLM
ncbi:hypothetical protein [Saliphagus infecundisoli]|uniref:Uncharacterized protein n=1 Tax=Saliphagus infecundisoli TaxID=1849069 RepID=A0ABD5QB54_9EURY|nr:hypothetical protein [Saliphagus infecundisoli]